MNTLEMDDSPARAFTEQIGWVLFSYAPLRVEGVALLPLKDGLLEF